MNPDDVDLDIELVDEHGNLLPSVSAVPDPRPAPGYPLGPGGAPPVPEIPGVDPYAIPAYRHARMAIAHEPRAHYEPPPPSRLELARRSYEDALELARSIDRLDLTDRSRILDCIAAAWPEVVAAAIEDIARGHRYEYALELVQ